jgi:hypothetical protein
VGLNAALVDQARTVERLAAGRRVEGRTIYGTSTGAWFRCRLQLPPAGERTGDTAGVRAVQREPTLMLGVKDTQGEPLALRNNMRVEVNSRELGRSTWDVVGDPEPMRKKRRVIGFVATLRRVEAVEAEES